MESNIIKIITTLQGMGSDYNRLGMSRFGINVKNAFGISMVQLKLLAKTIGKNHQLALELWQTEYHEARILAILIDDPKQLSNSQIGNWAADFNSWDLCDQACMKLFCYNSALALPKIEEWVVSEQEFIKRASFALMAALSLHYKPKNNEIFTHFLEIILLNANDERNFVKKAVNWALRQIGKRNLFLHEAAIETANTISYNYSGSKAAIWIAKDALRELYNEKIMLKIAKSRHNEIN